MLGIVLTRPATAAGPPLGFSQQDNQPGHPPAHGVASGSCQPVQPDWMAASSPTPLSGQTWYLLFPRCALWPPPLCHPALPHCTWGVRYMMRAGKTLAGVPVVRNRFIKPRYRLGVTPWPGRGLTSGLCHCVESLNCPGRWKVIATSASQMRKTSWLGAKELAGSSPGHSGSMSEFTHNCIKWKVVWDLDAKEGCEEPFNADTVTWGVPCTFQKGDYLFYIIKINHLSLTFLLILCICHWGAKC